MANVDNPAPPTALMEADGPTSIAVVIPAYKVTKHILPLLARIGPEVTWIYVVDDACPENTGLLVERECHDPRVVVLRNPTNLGVGGAVMTGYREALAQGCDCVVKIDGDGQMDPSLLTAFTHPIVAGLADYTKGNRFFRTEDVTKMPIVRLVGNAVLSFMSKLSTGYWRLFDPTNGYTAISTAVVAELPLDKISNRYFFETDLLFRLGLLRAAVEDVPMKAVYGDEQSNLRIARVLPQFLLGHMRNFAKRIFYDYVLRDFSVATIELLLGSGLLLFSLAFGTHAWWVSDASGHVATSGTVMLAGLPAILGVQLLLSFLAYDIRQRDLPLSPRLRIRASAARRQGQRGQPSRALPRGRMEHSRDDLPSATQAR